MITWETLFALWRDSIFRFFRALQVGKTDWEEIHTVVNFIYFRQIGIVITNQSKYYSANTLLLDEFLWLRIRITLMEVSRLPP